MEIYSALQLGSVIINLEASWAVSSTFFISFNESCKERSLLFLEANDKELRSFLNVWTHYILTSSPLGFHDFSYAIEEKTKIQWGGVTWQS